MVLFITQFKLSDVISDPMTYIANLNTPLSMIVIDTNLGAINLKEDCHDKLAWSGVFIRNLFLNSYFRDLMRFAITSNCQNDYSNYGSLSSSRNCSSL